jgi:hypothetical protein
MRQSDAIVMGGQARANSTLYWRVAARCRVIAYLAAVSPLLLMLILASLYPSLNRTEIPDWKPLVSVADALSNREDLYQARHLYLQIERIASWREDWMGLVYGCLPHQQAGRCKPALF